MGLRQLALLMAAWFLVSMIGMGLVVYGFGAFFQQREQHRLLDRFRDQVARATKESFGLPGASATARPPHPGAPVAVLEIGSIKLQQVVVEGVRPSDTRKGPGHVPGTAGLGQPGNSVVVARRRAFGGPFGPIDRLRGGDAIVLTTMQGQSVYKVTHVGRVRLGDDAAIDRLYRRTADNRLTLVTSRAAQPLNQSDATVVTATLETKPYAPTPSGRAAPSRSGPRGERGAAPAAALLLVVYGATLGASVLLYRFLGGRTAYLLTVCPVVAVTFAAGETMSRLLPAWT